LVWTSHSISSLRSFPTKANSASMMEQRDREIPVIIKSNAEAILFDSLVLLLNVG